MQGGPEEGAGGTSHPAIVVELVYIKISNLKMGALGGECE